MIAIAPISDDQSFARLRPEWEALWQRDPAATPFQSPVWLFAWWRFFGSPEPLVLTARDGGELVGILPLYLLRDPGCRKLLPVGVGLSDYIDAVIDPAAPAAASRFMAAIGEISGWDECWLPDLTLDGVLARAAAPSGLMESAAAAAPCPVLRLPRDPGRLGEVVPGKTLRDLRQARTRAAAQGGLAIETIAEDRLDAAMDDLLRLHEQRWRARGEQGLCTDPRVQGFHRAAAAGLLAAGMLRLYRLWIGGVVGAVYYGFAAKGRAYAYLGGFDPAQPRLSPGMQIIAHAIERAVAEGAASFDFLRGAEAYKYSLGRRRSRQNFPAFEAPMPGLTEAEEAACPVAARPVLAGYLAGEVSAEIALMHLLLGAGGLSPLLESLRRLAATRRGAFTHLRRLADRNSEALARAAALVEAGLTDAKGEDRVAAIREQYDRAAALAPEAAVALYSLGDPAILERATGELAALLDVWGLFGADRDALDIGCGIGRIEQALAPRLRHIIGIDLSPVMIAEAERRCANLANVAFTVCDGRALPEFPATGFDLVLAVDSFPCVVSAGPEIAGHYIREAARLLRPGGSLAIFNYSYRGDLAADRADIAAHAAAAGLRVRRNGTRDLSLWDGTSFLLSSPSRRG